MFVAVLRRASLVALIGLLFVAVIAVIVPYFDSVQILSGYLIFVELRS